MMNRLVWLLLVSVFAVACSQSQENQSIDKNVAQVDHAPQVVNNNFVQFTNDEKKIDWVDRDELVVHILAEPENLHPTNSNSQVRSLIMSCTQHSLVHTDEKTLELTSKLLESMPSVSDDQLTFTYHLKPDVKWDNGQSLTSDDVLFSIRASLCAKTLNGHHKSYFDNIASVTRIDDRSFQIEMKERNLYNIEFLSVIPVMQERFYDAAKVLSKYTADELRSLESDKDPLGIWAMEFNAQKFGRDVDFLDGLGAYRVTKWESSEVIELEKKKDHWNTDPAYPSRITFLVNKDPNSQAIQFKKQAFDVSTYVGGPLIEQLRTDTNFTSNYVSAYVPSFNFCYMAFNTKGQLPFMHSAKVRRAFALATPVQDIIDVVMNGKGTRMHGPVSPMKSDYNTDLKPLDLDLETARKMLEEEGWIDSNNDGIREKNVDGPIAMDLGFELLYLTVSPDWKDMAELISETMKEIGVKVSIRGMEYGPFLKKVRAHQYNAMLCAWGGSASPDDHSQLWSTDSYRSNGSNYTGFGSPETDALIDSINRSVIPAEHEKYSKRFQQAVYDETPYVFLYASQRKVIVHKRFKDIKLYYNKPGIILQDLARIK